MQDRFKFRIAVFERYNTDEWKFIKFIENTDKFGVSTNGNVIQENVQGYITHLTREKTPKNVYRTMEVIPCTGLKDKNGKLIYESDIVTYDDRDIYPYHTPILNAIIEMRKYQWYMIYYRKDIINVDTRKPAEQKTWLGFDDFITSRIEVIGNIYQDKEILQ